VTWADGWVGELGQEPTPRQYLAHLAEVFGAVRRVLKPDGTVWVIIGDSYATAQGPQSPTALDGKVRSGDQHAGRARITRQPDAPPKSLLGIPWRFALNMIDDGWIVRQDIIWAKTNPMPESVRDRCTRAHEYVFLIAKRSVYYWDSSAMLEVARTPANRHVAGHKKWADASDVLGGIHIGLAAAYVTRGTRNRRSVWTVAPNRFAGAHFATFPAALIRPMIAASCPLGGVVLDPFGGSGTTAVVASQQQRHCISIELKPQFSEIGRRRTLGAMSRLV
jgi:site-specific DNA-methyltransferase (adenine-specific)